MMSIDLENRLREAFDELSGETPDAAVMTDRAISRARGMRRRRSLLVGGGVTAAAAAVVAAALVGTSMRTGASTGQLRPAATPTAAAPSTPATTKPVTGSSTTTRAPNQGQKTKVGGYLLPHGSQLPAGLKYETADGKLTSTALQSATDNAMFLSSGLGSDVPGVDHSAPNNFGVAATVWDLAANHKASGANYGDGDPASRTLDSNVTRFKSQEYAATAIAKARAGKGPIIWFSSQRIPLVWSGVPGANGAHYLYDLGTLGVKEDYLAIQVIDDFIVSADSHDKASATRAVTDMVANLRTAKLVK